jgi:hypothetical protein
MAENASHAVTAPRKTTVESVEEEIARTRERLSVTLTQLNGDVRALLNPNTPVMIAPVGDRDATDKVAAGLRTAGQINALARPRKAGPFGMLRAVTGLTVFLFGSGIAPRVWRRKRR